MFAVVRMELRSFLRSRRALFWVGALQFGLLWFIIALWPDEVTARLSSPDLVARATIYEFLEKLLLFLMALAPIVTVSAFSRERDRAALHLLVLTDIRPSQIVLGKATASLLYLTILLLSSLPAFALVLQVGGVPLSSIFLLYALLFSSMLYFGMLGMFISLGSRSTARALVITALLGVAINLVFPSFQLYGQIIRDFLDAGGFGSTTWNFPNFFPDPERLYSTPEFAWFYLIDLLSPFSVFCNFRYVQLQALQPEIAYYAGANPRAAPDFRMVYEHLVVVALIVAWLFAGCVRRLEARARRTAIVRPGLRETIEGRVRRSGIGEVFFGTMLIGMALRCSFDLFDVTPGRTITLMMMWMAGLMMGIAGATSIAEDRERGTLRLMAMADVGTKTLLGRTFTPPAVRLLEMAEGYGAALLLTGDFGSWTMFGGLSRLFGSYIAPGSLLLCLRAVACVAAAGLFAWGIGVGCSAFCRRTVQARLWTFLILFACWMMDAMAGDGTGATIGRALESDLHGPARGVMLSLAVLKDGALGLIHWVNPFAAARFLGRDQGAWEQGAPGLASMAPLLGAVILALAIVQVARLRLVQREHFSR